MTRKRGFSLIEALIALGIAAVALTAILELQHQLALGQIRNDAAVERLTRRHNAIVVIRDLNPLAQPQGESVLGPGQSIQWTSEAVSPIRRSIGFPRGDGVYDVQLFRVTVRLDNGRASAGEVFTVERLGWRRRD